MKLKDMVYGPGITRRPSLKQLWSGADTILYIHEGPSHRKIESQEAEAMHQQAKHGLIDAW